MKKILLIIAVICCTTAVWADTIVKDTIMVTNNGYINEGAKTTKLIQSVWNMEVRTITGFTRWGLVEIPLDRIDLDATKIEFKIYLTGEKLATRNADQTLNTTSYTSDDLTDKNLKLSLYLLNYSFDSNVTWDLKTVPTSENEVWVSDVAVDNASKDTYLVWDVTSLVKARKTANQTHIRLRLTAKDATQMLRLRQVKISTGETGSYFPRLVQERSVTGLQEVNADKSIVFPTVANNQINVSEGTHACVYDLGGKIVLNQRIENKTLNISGLKNGMYLLKTEAGSGRFIKK